MFMSRRLLRFFALLVSSMLLPPQATLKPGGAWFPRWMVGQCDGAPVPWDQPFSCKHCWRHHEGVEPLNGEEAKSNQLPRSPRYCGVNNESFTWSCDSRAQAGADEVQQLASKIFVVTVSRSHRTAGAKLRPHTNPNPFDRFGSYAL
ncbi:hypothetical protein V8F06_012088 [Rhypophila decipiens]